MIACVELRSMAGQRHGARGGKQGPVEALDVGRILKYVTNKSDHLEWHPAIAYIINRCGFVTYPGW